MFEAVRSIAGQLLIDKTPECTKNTRKVSQVLINFDVYWRWFICSSGLNFQDLIVRQGAIDSPPKTPFILGFECAGEIEQVGEGVTNFKVINLYKYL